MQIWKAVAVTISAKISKADIFWQFYAHFMTIFFSIGSDQEWGHFEIFRNKSFKISVIFIILNRFLPNIIKKSKKGAFECFSSKVLGAFKKLNRVLSACSRFFYISKMSAKVQLKSAVLLSACTNYEGSWTAASKTAPATMAWKVR